jgi:hypothetical protein
VAWPQVGVIRDHHAERWQVFIVQCGSIRPLRRKILVDRHEADFIVLLGHEF